MSADDTDSDLDTLMAAKLANQEGTATSPSAAVTSSGGELSLDDDLLLADVLSKEAARGQPSPPQHEHRANPQVRRPSVRTERHGKEASAGGTQATTSVSSSSDTMRFTEKDEELLLQELVALTTVPAPFVSSAAVAQRKSQAQEREKRAGVLANATSAQPTTSSSPSSHLSARRAVSKPVASTPVPGSRPASSVPDTHQGKPHPQSNSTSGGVSQISLNEEEAVLDAILGSIECQQSTVSGDLSDGGPGGATPATHGGGRRGAHARVGGEAAQEEEEEEVSRVLAHAEAVAGLSLLADGPAAPRKGDAVLSFHEHAALRRALQPPQSSLGRPTCAALRPMPFTQSAPRADKDTDLRGSRAHRGSGGGVGAGRPTGKLSLTEGLYLALGTSLGAVMLYSEKWSLLGVCGTTEAGVVAQRGGVVSLSMPSVPPQTCLTIASGHEKGPYILWSADTLAPLRVLLDEFSSPVMVARHLFCEPFRTLCLEAAGCVKLLTFTRVLSKTMFRSSTVAQGHQTSSAMRGLAGIVDFDVIPHPSLKYLQNINNTVDMVDRGEVPVLFYAPSPLLPAPGQAQGVQQVEEVDLSASPFVVPGRHLIATVSSDTLVLHALETGLANVSTPVARHTHPPSSSLSNELVRFVLVEHDTPKVVVCVSWNMEIELVRVVFDVEGNATHLESIAMTTLFSPVQSLCAVAGGGVLLLDQGNNVLLFDATVAVLVEKHAMKSLDPVGFTHRLSGVRYQGSLTTNHLSAFFLGRDKMFTCTMLPWDERLKALLVRKKYAKALDLAQDLAEEVALCAVGLSTDSATRRRALKRYMEATCVAYIGDTIADVKAERAKPFALHTVLDRILMFCSRVDELEEVFFGQVMSTLRQARESAAAFVALEKAMLKNVVTSMPELYVETFYHFFATNARAVAAEDEKYRQARQEVFSMEARSPPGSVVHPTIPVAGFAGKLEERGGAEILTVAPAGQRHLSGWERAENALMHLETNIECLEKLAKDNGLVRLAVTVLSLRREKFGAALRLALSHTATDGAPPPPPSGSSSSSLPSTWASRQGCDVALAYLECTMRGASLLPDTDLPSSVRVTAKRQVWANIVGDDDVFHQLLCEVKPARRFIDVLLRALGDTDAPFTPWTRDHLTLSLRFNLAKVFALLIRDEGQWERGHGAQARNTEKEVGVSDPAGAVLFDEEAATTYFKPWDIARTRATGGDGASPSTTEGQQLPSYAESVDHFLSGLAELLCRRHGQPLAHALKLPQDMKGLARVMVTHFTFMFQEAETPTDRHNVQSQLTRFMKAAVAFGGSGISFQPFAKGFRSSGMARCLAAVYCAEGDYTRAIDCYLDKENNKAEPKLAESVFALLRAEVLRLEQEQLSAPLDSSGDNNEAAQEARKEVPKAGRGSKSAMHKLRRAVMERVGALVQIDATALAQFVFDFLPSNSDDVMKVLRSSSKTFLLYLDELLGKGDVAVASDVNLQNNYIELLCAHEPQRVYPYLKEHDTRITYDVQVVLKAVRKHKIADASVFLLEKTLMVDEAMAVLTAALRDAVAAVRSEKLAEVLSRVYEPGDVEGQESVPSAASSKAAGASAGQPSSLTHTSAAAAAVVEHLLAVGTDFLCSFQQRTSKATAAHWFRFLDTFATPRRVLSAWEGQLEPWEDADDEAGGQHVKKRADAPVVSSFWSHEADELAVAAQIEARGQSLQQPLSVSAFPLPHIPSAGAAEVGVPFVRAMVAEYAKYTALLLRTMVRVLDLSVVVSKIVQDNADETFGPFKPIIVDIMGAISFDLEVKRLCRVCVEEDLVELGSSLYRHLNSGIVPLSDACRLCHRSLSSQPPPLALTAETAPGGGGSAGASDAARSVGDDASASAVCVFVCGHGFHEACRAAAASVDGRQDCIQCHLERAGAVQRARYAFLAEAARAETGPAAATGSARLDKTTNAMLARRLRHTRAKMDQCGGYYSVLQSFVAATASARGGKTSGASSPSEILRKLNGSTTGGGGFPPRAKLLRAPAPPLPVSLGEIGSRESHALDLTTATAVTNTLTDAEILELFGDG